jgi:hypothetical protein
MILLVLFAVGLLYFWLRTDLKADEHPEDRPHLHIWGRFYPR